MACYNGAAPARTDCRRGWRSTLGASTIRPMPPVPLYHPRNQDAAYQLRYSWTGWPSAGRFNALPSHLIDDTTPLCDREGLRVLEHRWTAELVQILFSTKPDVAPEFVAARAKGRLDHALRTAQVTAPFSRKVSLRSVGDNTRRDVEVYVDRQVPKQRFVDPRTQRHLAEFTVKDESVDLSQPFESAHGRYWYNLHMVLIVDGRCECFDLGVLGRLRDGCFLIANKKGHYISRLAVMPDHLHVALRGTIKEAPIDLVFAYQNNLAHLLGKGRIWNEGFYVGSFGEYTTHAVRDIARGTK
jgi:REP element-mobilizing transposase RayT